MDHKTQSFTQNPFEEGYNDRWKPVREISVSKISQDNPVHDVFQDSSGVYYAMTRLPYFLYIDQHKLIVETTGMDTRIRDQNGNRFWVLAWYEARNLTWKGKPLFTFDPPASTARSGHEDFRAKTHVSVPIKAAPSISEWTTGRGPLPPWSSMPESGRNTREPMPLGGTPMYPANEDGVRGSIVMREDPIRTRGEDYHRRVRPSMLQKLVKRFDGSSDPHDHVAAYKQAIHAEQVTDTHTQVEGFGLTLESKALTWFQTLEPESKTSLARLEKDFTVAFSKMGMKHNAVAQIYSFQQRDHETVRDCVNRLKQYIVRCPDDEKPSQARLISIFLEGLKSRTLYKHLYACRHSTFNECCYDAMEFDDNFVIPSQEIDQGRRQASQSDAISSQDPDPDQIVDAVLKRLGQNFQAPNHQWGYQQTAPQNAVLRPLLGASQPSMRYWCQLCRWNFTHVTKDCVHIDRLAQERDNALRSQGNNQAGNSRVDNPAYPRQEATKPVLGSQPPPLGTVPVHYAEADNPNTCRDLVLVKPYAVEPNPKCYRCGGNHLVKDCPEPPPPRKLPPVDIFCEGCCLDHLPKDCPIRNASAQSGVNYIGVVPSPHPAEAEADRQSLNVITRAQSRKNAAAAPDVVGHKADQKVKKKRARKPRSRRSKKAKSSSQEMAELDEQAQDKHEPAIQANKENATSSSPSSGGSVIVDKVNETLQAALDAYNSRIPPLTEIPKKLQEYPNPREEKVRLAVHQNMIKDTQTMLEGPPPIIKRGPISKRPDLETILEVSSSQERDGSLRIDRKSVV